MHPTNSGLRDGQVIDRAGQAGGFQYIYSEPVLKPMGKHMMKYTVLAILALLTVTCAVLEGLVESLSPQFIQLVGLLTIVCTGVFIGWTLRLQARSFKRD